MTATRLVATGWRNLAPLDLELPARGAVLLGGNGQGKTNLLEAIYYPVLFRSLRGARDQDLVGYGEAAFHLSLAVAGPDGATTTLDAGFAIAGKRKRVAVDGAEPTRVTDALGRWLAVGFLPTDVALVAGAAADRRQFLDRTLALTSPAYLGALRRFRAALEQRNAALRRREPELAWAFDPPLARAGARVVAERLAWVERAGPEWAAECAALGEPIPVSLGYRGRVELADPEAWPGVLEPARDRDLASGTTGTGPHRDDLALELDGVPLRIAGSTGQQRTAAVALKLVERDTLARAHGRAPTLLLDDVFAELDRSRQDRLAERLGLGADRQVFVTAPRADELPPGLGLPVYRVAQGTVRPAVEWEAV